jgi:hypothetical protein
MVVYDTTSIQDIWFKSCITMILGTLTNTWQYPLWNRIIWGFGVMYADVH